MCICGWAWVLGYLAVIGLTGSVLVFWHELDEAINPALLASFRIKVEWS
jgi:uncharacterized iron-regulated membrane protein